MLRFKVYSEFDPNMLKGPVRESETWLANEVLKDTRKYVPELTSSLVTRAYVDGDTVVYPGPYARYLYYGKVMIDPVINAAGYKRPDGTWRSRKGAVKQATNKDLVFTKKQAQAFWFEASKAQNLQKWMRGVAKLVGK